VVYDAIQRASGRAEKAQPPCTRGLLDHLNGCDSIGHFAGDVLEADSMLRFERGVAQVLRMDARQDIDGSIGEAAIEEKRWRTARPAACNVHRFFVAFDCLFQVPLGNHASIPRW
jgi:hypothetical protein